MKASETVSGSTSPGVNPSRRTKPPRTDKVARLLRERADWTIGHLKTTGAPFFVIKGDSGSHFTDLLDCSCPLRQFQERGPLASCTHMAAVRRWYTGLRTGQIGDDPREPHRRLHPGDLDHFEAQDLVLARVADSLMRTYESLAGTSPDPGLDVPWDDGGLRAERTRDRDQVALRRQAALVDPDAAPTVRPISFVPPDERP